MRNALVLLAASFLLCACGERPQRVASAGSAPGQKVVNVPRFSGTIDLEGGMAGVQSGALYVSARRKGQRLPTLSRKYEMNDPAWSTQDGHRVLRFVLTDENNMGGFGAPMGAEMEVEARYSPSGFIDPRPGGDEEGVVRASVPASPGDDKLSIVLRATSGK